MGIPEPFPKELLMAGILSTDPEMREDARGRLEMLYGPSGYAGRSLPFTYTGYYRPEMGGDIVRDFIFFHELADPSSLADVKLACNEIERRYVQRGGRRVNLDPGLLSLGKLILASTKDNAQRIPLREGIYAEITLIYRDGAYRPLPWTYPDYRSPEYQQRLLEMRELLRGKLKAERG